MTAGVAAGLNLKEAMHLPVVLFMCL